MKYFETQRAQLEARNLELKKEAEKVHATLDGKSFIIIPSGRRNRTALRIGFDARYRRCDHCRRRERQPQPGRADQPPIKAIGLHNVPIHLHAEVDASITLNVARSPEEADRQARGEELVTREETSMDDLGLEVGAALAEAGGGDDR